MASIPTFAVMSEYANLAQGFMAEIHRFAEQSASLRKQMNSAFDDLERARIRANELQAEELEKLMLPLGDSDFAALAAASDAANAAIAHAASTLKSLQVGLDQNARALAEARSYLTQFLDRQRELSVTTLGCTGGEA